MQKAHTPASSRAQALIREATTRLIADPEALFGEVDAAVLATQPPAALADAELTEAIRASNRSNLAHWAAANLADPGVPVDPNRAPETLGLARLIARRGIEDTSRVAYGAGQNAAWTAWMRAVFTVTSDPGELQEVLEVSARSVFGFVDAMLELLRVEIERERGQVLSSDNAHRLHLINRLLRGGVSPQLIQELRYRVDLFGQTAVVLSHRNDPETLLGLVEAAAAEVGARLRRRPLTVVADADTVWAWFASDEPGEPIDPLLADTFGALLPDPLMRIGIGPTQPGYAGFRDGHADAVAAVAVSHLPVIRSEAVAIATLAVSDPDRARAFVARRLGGLSGELADTLAAYLAHRGSPTRTAAATFTHRNTVIDRIRRAEAQLPIPISGHELELGVALELARAYRPRGERHASTTRPGT